MIADKINNIHLYTHLGGNFQKAFSFITDPELLFLENGRYEIDGDNVYALISEYKTKDLNEGKLEAHKKYIDVQFMAKGEELIGYTPFQDQNILSEYNEEKDICFYNGDKSFLKIEQGMFAVFFPGELHMPGITSVRSNNVKKIVVKIKA
jgi:YhcH/YjgK/YiaL family protein